MIALFSVLGSFGVYYVFTTGWTCPCRSASSGSRPWTARPPALGLRRGAVLAIPALRPRRLHAGHADRRAARPGTGGRHRDPDPAHLQARSDRRHHHAAAIYYGAMYGGTITSVLINVPGEAASVVTCIDGYQMARQGRGRGGPRDRGHRLVRRRHVGHRRAGRRGPAARAAGLEVRSAGVLRADAGRPLPGHRPGGQDLAAALLMTVIGLLLAMIGVDPVRGAPRFTFGIAEPLRRHRLRPGGHGPVRRRPRS